MNARKFETPYIGVDTGKEFDILYGASGEFSVVVAMKNPVIQHSAAAADYDEFQNMLTGIIKILGDGYLLQKQDILYKAPFDPPTATEYLQQKFNAHFAGRAALRIDTYLTITRQVKKGRFYVYDAKQLRDFRIAIIKVTDVLKAAKCEPILLNETQISDLIRRVLAMRFGKGSFSLNNFKPTDTEILMGDRAIRCIPLVNSENVDMPSEIGTFTELNENEAVRGFPVDMLSFLNSVPAFEAILYNQVIEIPAQQFLLNKLEVKRKRHSGIPDPANLLCVEDIDQLLKDVARNGQLLVNVHYSIVLSAPASDIQRSVNFIESALFQLGIIPNQNAYNQLELFRAAMPGNGVELKNYDWFLTTSDAALCLFFKERQMEDEPSSFRIRLTDRKGIPVAIDPADLPMRTGRINNRNKFVLGPSGSGKSFFMNSLVEQYLLFNVDVVIVDVGHSYSGLCAYYGGKYITWSDERPITMNPFLITEDEYNLEKKDNLVTLIALLWKGAGGSVSTIERDVLTAAVSGYYALAFSEGPNVDLSFNGFYEFALNKIPEIKNEERIPFDLDEFRYVLKKFYRGGEYESILNEASDQSLLTEPFVVYEIDALQDNAVLLPIVTLIIMDVFIQKMRNRKNQRKVLILEEAWRALMSPIMSSFLLYLNKTVRKFWGEVIEVTQELSDIISNPVVKDSIINNSDTVILLDQRKFRDNYGEIAKVLSISPTEQRKIFTINQLDNKDNRARFNEVYIRRGSVGEVYGVEVSRHQYYVYTTEKPEKNAVQVYVHYFGTYPAALDAFLMDMDRSGTAPGDFINKINQHNKPLTFFT
ncbi:TraG family conjugative transposon ATPase [Mucilaginibacter rubeus]|uniref:TraG family conjugative transposon ATPase n=1 Tax=Mucilaginibacter rubeus TaxID=2027860 RepID=A0AAE6MLU3_9SPHI|nr:MULTISPECIES: TraG family conjugative transposon ATPase [Mucilaginibacter]QEM07849.1 TraG family conjugative transposon ATPase [Mucilaginibacter rubeus]QEM20301.1 TraG family conjugative transposon ATPase [Mucilaginibacter gossypii]QTE42981.1 TraG family conjugative transposon ATPase [Mucilaginibacter rubeus]QTE49582.1 TraG family conjugative transposon ATPase [Mucilaginibacter rubeus]QTE54678.1 TraG family conjugative transposon ATPase [Mucilaginibacter rubeus]